jgi:RNA polymerase sigma-70 factor (ECF subfamily)
MLRYQNRVVTILEHLVGRRGAAEDLAQDVFLRVYRARKSYTPGARFSTWLFTIANNVASNALRTMSRRREINVESSDASSSGARVLDQLAQAASGLMPARQLDRLEVCDVVRLAIGHLSQRQRMAVLLSKFEHMSYADIATTMELTPQAIKSLLSRARENLREVLAPYFEHGESPDLAERTGDDSEVDSGTKHRPAAAGSGGCDADPDEPKHPATRPAPR